MAQLKGCQQFPFQPQAAERPSQKGDGGVLARFITKPTELPTGDLQWGAFDYDFDAVVQALSVVATFGAGEFIGRQPGSPTYQDMIFLCTAQAKSQESATLGSGLWEGRLIYKANVEARGRDSFNTDAMPTYGYSIIANPASAYPWGLAFVAGTDGDAEFVFSDFTWPYRPILQRWTGNAVVVSWELAQNIAEDSTDNIIAYSAGVALTWVTGAPAGGQFGITAGTPDLLVEGTATASNGKLVALYGWS
jgi:hypothetical protein